MTKTREIGSLLALLFFSLFVSLSTVTYMAYNWGPTGTYKLKNILLAPEGLKDLVYQEVDNQTARGPRFVFDTIEFIHTDRQDGSWKQQNIKPFAYAHFFDLIRKEESLSRVTPSIEEDFVISSTSRIQLMVKPERQLEKQNSSVFQQVQFSASGDYYRVELRLDTRATSWAYFYHPNITKEATSILANTP